MNVNKLKKYCQFCLKEQDRNCPKVPINRDVKQNFYELTNMKLNTTKFSEFICCDPCMESFEFVINFKQTLVKNQKALTRVSMKSKEDSMVIEEYLIQEDDETTEEYINEESVEVIEESCYNEISIIEALESETEIKEEESSSILLETFKREEDLEVSQLDIIQQQKKKYPKKRLKDPITCPKCDRQFYFKAYFQFHYKDVHRKDLEEICQYCGKVFKNIRRLNSHLVVHQSNNLEKRHKCEICGKQFHFSGDLTRHKRVHENNKPFKCHICTKSFIQSYALKLHINVHNKVRYSCDMCGATFSGKPTLKKHLTKCMDGKRTLKVIRDDPTSQRGKEKYKCLSDGCERQFSSRKYLGFHLDKCHNLKFSQFETTCLDCLLVFDNIGDYSVHVKTHSCNFVCDLCKVRFRTDAKLQSHIEKTHKEGEKRPFVCLICDARFKRVEHLKGHTDYKHSDQKRFQCEYCSSKFRYRGEFNVHIRIHRNENPFSCWQCSHTCKTSSNLRQHMSLVHNIDCIYFCKSCQKSFRYNTDLTQHNKEHHSMMSACDIVEEAS